MSGTDINGNWWYARNFWNFSLWNSKSPFQLQFLWLDPYNYSAITQHWYSKQLPFGYNLYYLEKRRRRAQAYVSACGRKETQIIHDAVNTINFLEYRLDNKKYFYGDKYVILKHNPFSSASYIYNISVLFERLCVVNIILFFTFFQTKFYWCLNFRVFSTNSKTTTSIRPIAATYNELSKCCSIYRIYYKHISTTQWNSDKTASRCKGYHLAHKSFFIYLWLLRNNDLQDKWNSRRRRAQKEAGQMNLRRTTVKEQQSSVSL